MSLGLLRYAGRRVLQAIPLLLGILTLTFVLMHAAPGDPTATYLTDNVSPEVVEQTRARLGLDEPVPVQYVKWIRAFAVGDFGRSYVAGEPEVRDKIGAALPNTLLLGLVSLAMIFVVGGLIGVIQAVRQYSVSDTTLTIGSLALYSMPGFWLGLMLQIAVSSGWWPDALSLPVSGMIDVRDHSSMTLVQQALDVARHLVLPTVALGLASAAGIARYMRGEMLEVIHQDYVRTARAKGLSERRVIFRHALRNALIPIVSLLGLYLPVLIGGSVVIEKVFAWPGMGLLLYDSVYARDYPTVMAATFLFGAIVVVGNLISDLLYAAADPRIRYE
ncbi:MAG TPA: ABC transporter permease [Gemmatimonadota bacterium]|nr:ABC transporter permease [Gemmatimonadota bacterium]